MHRPAACLWLAALTTCGLAQERAPERPPVGLVMLVVGPGRQLVAGARGTFFCEPTHRLPALGDLDSRTAAALPVPSAQWFVGTSSERGVLRAARPGDDPSGRAGAGLVTTDQGLGALVGRLLPGPAQRVELQPMAAVTTATGSETFTLHARAWLPSGEAVRLPASSGTEVRLPGGTYEVWAQSADGWTWQRLELASGQRTELRFDGPAQRLRRSGGARVHPAGFPEVDLFGDHGEATLRGGALGAPLAGMLAGTVLPPQVVPGPPRLEAILWPPATEPAPRLRLGAPSPVEQARDTALVTLARGPQGRWSVLHVSPLHRDAAGAWYETAASPQGDSWLLLLASERAPLALPWSERARFGEHARDCAQRIAPLVVRARDESGLPAVDLAVDYVPANMEPATVLGHTDAGGTARLGPVVGPGTLRTSDPRFANQDLHLETIPAEGVTLTVASGSELSGRVTWPDGSAAAGVPVTLRDPRGRLRPEQRTVVCAADGTFHFTGLRDDLDYVLFASTPREGRTWTARLARALPGEPVELTVRDEDPVLGPARDGR
ncbi:MAG: carboxypeptidase regulatory-like domain-containing protein [Planctomycetes bacterium]|nr:carboxypeptidase regulatory-like domain-containing protein [Planctomycetota bacterium]